MEASRRNRSLLATVGIDAERLRQSQNVTNWRVFGLAKLSVGVVGSVEGLEGFEKGTSDGADGSDGDYRPLKD